MKGKAQQEVAFVTNLEDAGCDCDLARRCIALKDAGKMQEMLRELSGQRKQLLENLHVAQRQIDCLDYLLYKIRKALESKEK